MSDTHKKPTPNPGTNEAIKQGCTCPVIDNEHGRGYMGQKGIFVYNGNCQVHKLPTRDKFSPTEQ